MGKKYFDVVIISLLVSVMVIGISCILFELSTFTTNNIDSAISEDLNSENSVIHYTTRMGIESAIEKGILLNHFNGNCVMISDTHIDNIEWNDDNPDYIEINVYTELEGFSIKFESKYYDCKGMVATLILDKNAINFDTIKFDSATYIIDELNKFGFRYRYDCTDNTIVVSGTNDGNMYYDIGVLTEVDSNNTELSGYRFTQNDGGVYDAIDYFFIRHNDYILSLENQAVG